MSNLICSKCGSLMVVSDWEKIPGMVGLHEYKKCFKCGSRNIKKEKFVERENPATIIRTELVERVKEEAKTMGKSGQCKFEGCDKVRLAGGYCYRHYKEVNGHPYKGGLKNHKGGNIEMPTEQKIIPAVEATQADPVPLFQIFLDPELLDRLTERAKKEYRSPEQQAAYILHKELSA